MPVPLNSSVNSSRTASIAGSSPTLAAEQPHGRSSDDLVSKTSTANVSALTLTPSTDGLVKPQAARTRQRPVPVLAPYVGAIDMDVFSEPCGALPGLPQAEQPSRLQRFASFMLSTQAPRPANASWLLNFLDRRTEIRTTPAVFLAQTALLSWDAMSGGAAHTPASLVAAFTQLAPALLLPIFTGMPKTQRGITAVFDALSLAAYPVGMPLALGALAALEAGEANIKKTIELRLGRTDSALLTKNVLQAAATMGALALGREIEHVSGVHAWYYTLARHLLAVPGDGCQMWLDPRAGVSLFINCVDTSGPKTVAISCGTALGSCAAAAFGSLNRTRVLPDASQALTRSNLADALETIIQRNSSQLSNTFDWVQSISAMQTTQDYQPQAANLIQSLVGSRYLAAVANDSTLSDTTLASMLAAVAIRVERYGDGFNSQSAYDALKNVYGALGYRNSVVSVLNRMVQNQSLTHTIVDGEYGTTVNGGAAVIAAALLTNPPSVLDMPAACRPVVGNLAIQWADGIKGSRPDDLIDVNKLTAYGRDPDVYFPSCDTEDYTDPYEPIRAVAQEITKGWGPPSNFISNVCTDNGGTCLDWGKKNSTEADCNDWETSKTCKPEVLHVPVSYDAWRANLTNALLDRNATSAEARTIAASWDALRSHVAALFGNKTLQDGAQ